MGPSGVTFSKALPHLPARVQAPGPPWGLREVELREDSHWPAPTSREGAHTDPISD